MGENSICTICRVEINQDNPGVLVGNKGIESLLNACLARNPRDLHKLIKTQKDVDPQFKVPVHVICRQH